jgi:Lamin Tail Domain
MPLTWGRLRRDWFVAGIVAALPATACAGAPAEAAPCDPRLAAGEVVFTEVFADPAGPNENREWLELYNASGRDVTLAGVTLLHERSDGSRSRSHVLAALTLDAGQYAVLGGALDELRPPHVNYGYGAALGELYNSGAGRLQLRCADVELDTAMYQSGGSGVALGLDGGEPPDAVGNDERGRWCVADEDEFEQGGWGSPGARNQDCEVVLPGKCRDGALLRDTAPPRPGDLVITELMPDPAKVTDAAGEWLELAVHRDVDLNGVALDRLGDSAPPSELAQEACLRVTAGSFAVLAREAQPADNGGLPRVDAPLPISLVGGSAAQRGDVQLLLGTTLLDGVSWSRSASGRSHAVDPSFADPVANDDERGFCDGVAPYGAGDRGSPGAANPACAVLPPPGSCTFAGGTRAIDPPAPGQLVITEVMANPAGVDADQEWFEVHNRGADAMDLNDLGLDRGAGAVAPRPLRSAACLTVPAGGSAVLARSADPAKNGGLPAVVATFAFALGDAGAVRVLRGAEVADEVAWSDAPSAAALQLAPAFATVSGNDDESHFCAATAPYGDGENRGTPGAGNAGCR